MPDDDAVLHEQVAYYRARAGDYLEKACRVNGFDALGQALTDFRPSGDVLELACGPGTWTPLLLETADSVTALDAAPEMLAQARLRVSSERVTFVQADVFSWRPDRRYDTIFFGFWLSHVPPERFDGFWRAVEDALTPTGRVFFMDDALTTGDETRGDEGSSTVVRTTADGAKHRLVKVRYNGEHLQDRLLALGWQFEVHEVAPALYWGSGERRR